MRSIRSAENWFEFLQEIVRIPTENPPGRNYPECARAIGRKMEEAGLDVQYVEVPGELLPVLAPHGEALPRPSVIGKLAGSNRAALLHFTGHYDVVPAGEGWSRDPRSPRQSGKGRFTAVAPRIRSPGSPRRSLRSRPCGRRDSISVARSSPALHRTRKREGSRGSDTSWTGASSPGTTPTTASSPNVSTWTDLSRPPGDPLARSRNQGKQSHGSTPSEGVNAIEKMLDLLDAVRHEILPGYETVSRHPVMPPACRKSTFTVTMMEAGIKVNMVPASCRASLDWRLIPEQSVAAAKESLLALCRKTRGKGPEFEWCRSGRSCLVNPTLVRDDTDVVKAFQEAGRRILGQTLGFSVSPGSDDQKFVVQKAGGAVHRLRPRPPRRCPQGG